MYLMTLIATTFLISAGGPIHEPGPKPNGPFPHVHRCHALIGADVVTEPGTRLQDATIIIRDGRIESVGTAIEIPADARLWSMDDQVIYAGFVEPAMAIELDAVPSGPGANWSNFIHPQVNLGQNAELAQLSSSVRSNLRKAGYCTAAIYPDKGILRGTGTIVSLSDDTAHQRTMRGRPAAAAAFDRGGWGGGSGPGSLMGSIAMMRQTLHDARWYEAALNAAQQADLEPPARHDDLAALADVVRGRQRLMIDARDHKEAIRAGTLARDCDISLIVLGSGDEYRDLPGIASLQCPIIVPVEFPDAPRLASIDQAMRVPLNTLQAWEQAPTNLRRLRDAGIDACVTTDSLSSPSDIHAAMRQAIQAGLTHDEALARITTDPATLLGIDTVVGRIAPGMAAHLVVCDGDLFEEDTTIDETWVSGWREDHERRPLTTLKGGGTLTVGDTSANATIDTTRKKFTVTLADDTKLKIKKVDLVGHRMQASMDSRIFSEEGWLRVSAIIRDDELIGRAVRSDGRTSPLHLVISEDAEEESPSDEVVADADTQEEGDSRSIAGLWTGNIAFGEDFDPPIELDITQDEESYNGTLSFMEREMPLANGIYDAAQGTLSFSGTRGERGQYSMDIQIDGDAMTGTATSPMGEAEFTASRQGAAIKSTRDTDDEDGDAGDLRWANIPDTITFPLGARGRLSPVAPENVRFEHATLWTADDAGILEDGCLIVEDGHLTYVGSMAQAPPVGTERVVDATGMHITPGLIDCHSHTGIDGGVNEFNEACTAEVGIGDVVAGDDMNWYRQLAGGLTAANQLHGSANPIGGRNSVVKLRWGRPARDFHFNGAIKGIKFALGENVKRSSGRYPDTRMGVESFIRDRLAAAKAYDAQWKRWNTLTEDQQASRIPPRRDFELDTLAEILRGERLIHCHSYRQDEILALLRTCEDYGITIGTLQHILEGYKVADDIARHGAGASSFSDWWAYKVEVMDAIPWNGEIMHSQGVVVSFNSDDSELATRMNDEAAKAVRYGGLEPNEALKFVTLNPAIQLRVDDRTGSLKVGKDADFAVWNRDPLDSYSLCLETWIDGAKYFDRTQDTVMAARDAADRTRLVELVLLDNLGTPPVIDPDPDPEESEPAWAANPYNDIDDHRGCCGLPADHDHEEHTR